MDKDNWGGAKGLKEGKMKVGWAQRIEKMKITGQWSERLG